MAAMRRPGIVTIEHLQIFRSKFPEELGFKGYVSNEMSIESFLACIGFLSPTFVEYENFVFNEENLVNRDPKNYNRVSGGQKSDIEQYNNLISLCDFFIEQNGKPIPDDLFYLFGGVIKTFWKTRLEQVFPTRQFDVVLGYNLLGEEGLCITFYEVYPGCGSPPRSDSSWIEQYGNEVDFRYHYPNDINWLNLTPQD